MVYLRDYNPKYGYQGIMYNNRLTDVNKIIADKNIDVESTLQLFKLRMVDRVRKVPIFPKSYMDGVLEHGWHRRALSEHFQNMSYEELIAKKDSIVNFLGENDIYQVVVNHATYALIEKREYQKAVALAHILVIYEPGKTNEIDTLGEAYYNNGQIEMARHYDSMLSDAVKKRDGIGFDMWEKNKMERLKGEG